MAAILGLGSSRPRNTLVSLLGASTTGAGALFGRKMPNHDETSNFASSGPVSRTVGMLGADALRSGVVTASALSLPSCTCGNDGKRLSDRIWISPDSAACSAGPAPRNGTCTIFNPVSCSSQAMVRCGLWPRPDQP